MTKEFKTFILAIALPAAFVAAGGARLLFYTWNNMANEERNDLEHCALFLTEVLSDRAHAEAELCEVGHPPEKPPRHFRSDDPPGERRHPDAWRPLHAMPPRPPHLPKHLLTPEQRRKIAAICEEVRESKASVLPPNTTFELADAFGERIYAADDWPAGPATAVECHVGPPLGDGAIRVARTDGGKAMRMHAIAVTATGISIILLLVAVLVSGGVLFIRELHRERREARLKSDFIDNVSHELNTPLAGIRLTAELLADGRMPDAEQRHGALKSILTEADRLSRMVAELLDFSRLEKGTRRYAIETFDLATFATELAKAHSMAAISNGRADISVKGSGAIVSADKDAVRQIGVNLVSNAVKYSEEDIYIEVEGNEIRFMDRGPGIPPGCEERIFERFYRVDNSLTRQANGSGLGLSIARALARGMGGDLKYAHRSGGGSIFTLSLALADKVNGGKDK